MYYKKRSNKLLLPFLTYFLDRDIEIKKMAHYYQFVKKFLTEWNAYKAPMFFSCRISSWLHPVHKCVSSAKDFFFPGQQSVSGGLPLSLATAIHLQAQQQSSQTDLWSPVGILQQHSQEKSGSNSFSVSVACLRNICQPRLKVSRTGKNY